MLDDKNYTIMFELESVLVPIFVCVVLPVCIVWLVHRVRMNETNKKAEIMLKAIEAGVPVDMDQFKSGKEKSGSVKKQLLDKLTGACVTSLMGITFILFSIADHCELMGGRMFAGFSPMAGGILLAVGIGLFISYFAGKKLLATEIKDEEKKLDQEK